MTPHTQKPLLPLAPLLSEASEPSSSADGLSLKHTATAAMDHDGCPHHIPKPALHRAPSHRVSAFFLSASTVVTFLSLGGDNTHGPLGAE